MSKYYALKVEEEIVFIIPWDKNIEPTLSSFQFAIYFQWSCLRCWRSWLGNLSYGSGGL